MSKIYKSQSIQMGSPKPLINTFQKTADKRAGSEALQEIAAAREDMASGQEAAANNIIEDAKQMYLKIIEEANLEAQAVMDQAKADAENLSSSAQEEGFREGYAAGYEEGKKAAEAIMQEAAEIRDFLDYRRSELYREAEEEILDIILEISRKVIGAELENNQNAILSLIRQALEKCAFKNRLVLKVSMEDYEFVLSNKYNICKLVEGISDIEIISDPSLKRGGCIVETPAGEVNSSSDIQLKELERIFTFTLRNE